MHLDRVGALLKSARQAKNLTVKAAAEAIGISAATMKRWESGQGLPKAAEMAEVLQRIGYPDTSLVTTQIRGELVRFADSGVGAPRPILRLLRLKRRRHGITLENVSAATGFCLASLHRFETGERIPAPENLVTIGIACGLTDEEVIGIQKSIAGEPIPEPASGLLDLFEHPESLSHFELCRRLDRLIASREKECTSREVLDILQGALTAGDSRFAIESWDLIRAHKQVRALDVDDVAELKYRMAFARFRTGQVSDKVEALNRVSDVVRNIKSDVRRIDGYVSLVRIMATIKRPDLAQPLIEAVEQQLRDSGVDPETSFTHLLRAVTLPMDRKPENIHAELLSIEKEFTTPLLQYLFNIALSYVSLQCRDASYVRHSVGTCRDLEDRYHVGSPLLNGIAARARDELQSVEFPS